MYISQFYVTGSSIVTAYPSWETLPSIHQEIDQQIHQEMTIFVQSAELLTNSSGAAEK
jgi:hypothetical protein